MSCHNTILDGFPPLCVLAVMVWSYYPYVIQLCISRIKDESLVKETLYLITYHLLLIMVMWSFFKVMCVDIAVVPREYKLPNSLYETIKSEEVDEDKNYLLLRFCQERNLVVVCRNEAGHVRFCLKCKHIKPDRAHHCSTCQTCILKMDHHCPWINNCVCFSTYKFFVQFLFYSSLYCWFYTATTVQYFFSALFGPTKQDTNLQIIIGCVVSTSFGFLLLSFFCYHMSLILKNETSLEVSRKPVFRTQNEDLMFDIGTRGNFGEVFGPNCCSWFFPYGRAPGDGLNFPVRLLF